MASINWTKYLPKKFVYNNYSIDELATNYSDSMMFSEPIDITLVDDESIRDTLIDLHNYAAMAIMLLDETDSETKDNSHPSFS